MNTDQTNVSTGKRIRKYRKDLGLSQAALAEKADLPPNTVARLERGEHSAKTLTLRKIAKVLKVTIDDLLD